MDEQRKTIGRAILSVGGFFLLLAAAMFLPAGTRWTRGWLFLAVFFVEMALMALYLWRTNPAILAARSKIQAGTKGWDRPLFYILQILILAIFPVAATDHAPAPTGVVVLGYLLLSVGMAGNAWVLSVNKFAEMTVRIQAERSHHVVDRGPYAIVRHPMYVAFFPVAAGMPLALGSYWALIPAAIAAALLVVRTVLEDRMLQRELAGYKEYAGRIRYRLIPGVW